MRTRGQRLRIWATMRAISSSAPAEASTFEVGQVLVAERDANGPLHDQRPNAVFDQFRRPPIGEAGGKPLGEPDRGVRRAKQQRTGVGGDRAAVKPRHHLPPLHGCKSEQVRATLCGHRGTPLRRRKALLQKNFRRFGAPMVSGANCRAASLR
jgi:hypothetical protein